MTYLFTKRKEKGDFFGVRSLLVRPSLFLLICFREFKIDFGMHFRLIQMNNFNQEIFYFYFIFSLFKRGVHSTASKFQSISIGHLVWVKPVFKGLQLIEFAIDWFGSNFFKVYFTFFSLVELIDLLVAVAVVVALAVVVAVIVAVRHFQLSSRNFLELLFFWAELRRDG